MRTRRQITAQIALASAALLVMTGCSGNSIERTYFGTEGGTVLVLQRGGKCGYSEDYDEKEGVQVEISDKCSWSLSGSNLTLIGVISKNSLTAFVGDDGSISIPDQSGWRGEIYSKK